MPNTLIQPRRRPEVHGHRGCRGLRPENTLPAFQHALALGVDVLEMDVVISADNQVVVSHEPWFNPLFCLDPTGQPLPSSKVPRYNLHRLPYAEIRRFDCGLRRHPDFPEQVSEPAYKPQLREVLAMAEAEAQALGRLPVGYSIEIKSTAGEDYLYQPAPADFLALVLAELAAARVLARTTLLCFDPRILRLAHRQYPPLATCLLVEAPQPWARSIEDLGFVPTCLGPDFSAATPHAIKQLRTDFPALRLVPWTVNELTDMERLLDLGVDGITTDYPDRLLASFGTNTRFKP